MTRHWRKSKIHSLHLSMTFDLREEVETSLNENKKTKRSFVSLTLSLSRPCPKNNSSFSWCVDVSVIITHLRIGQHPFKSGFVRNTFKDYFQKSFSVLRGGKPKHPLKMMNLSLPVQDSRSDDRTTTETSKLDKIGKHLQNHILVNRLQTMSTENEILGCFSHCQCTNASDYPIMRIQISCIFF